MWEAADGSVLYSDGEAGVPLLDVIELVLSLAEEEGTGSQSCAAVGFAGSNGGALRLLLGTDETG